MNITNTKRLKEINVDNQPSYNYDKKYNIFKQMQIKKNVERKLSQVSTNQIHK